MPVIPKRRSPNRNGQETFLHVAQDTAQKQDLRQITKFIGKNVDYVVGWYFKAADFIQETTIKCAFVSTNSITQGEQVSAVWKPLMTQYNIHIDFAHRTFRWDSEASLKAHVHCVIIGFSTASNNNPKYLFLGDRKQIVENINGYLLNAPNIFIDRRSKPVCNVPEIKRGSQPTDDGNFIFSYEEMQDFIKKYPNSVKFFRPFMMGRDFINRCPRYCLWLVGANPSELKKYPEILKRVENVREFRLKSKKAATRAKAATPTLFDEIHDCKTDYVAIPKVSSENRRYIPMDYLKSEVIAGDKIFMMSNASLYHFGILTSNVHMAWMRAVCGRLEMRYSYSNTIVYNNFPWCEPTEKQKAKIEKTAQSILEARALYPENSFADLYDELTMPPELRKAHQNNDRAVMEAYGFSVRDMTESSCVAELMKRYQKLTEK